MVRCNVKSTQCMPIAEPFINII